MPALHVLETPTTRGRSRGSAPDLPPVRVLLAAGDGASAFDLRRLIAARTDLVAVGHALSRRNTLAQARDLRPDVVILDDTISHNLVLLARDLALLEPAPEIVIRVKRLEPRIAIAAVIAGVRGIVTHNDRIGSLCDAIRWVAREEHWLPELPVPELSRASARLQGEDVPILLMLLRGARAEEIAIELGITTSALDVRRTAMLLDLRVTHHRREPAARAAELPITMSWSGTEWKQGTSTDSQPPVMT